MAIYRPMDNDENAVALNADGAGEENRYQVYLRRLITGFWAYQRTYFRGHYFDQDYEADEMRPPVFIEQHENNNIITRPNANQDEVNNILALIPAAQRHNEFCSMRSSQALALSLFGNLKTHGCLNVLNNLTDVDTGMPLFGNAELISENINFEQRPQGRTSVDVFISGNYQIAVECKLAESLHPCSIKRCNGNYVIPRGQQHDCPSNEIWNNYWHYVSDLFNWAHNTNHIPCPLKSNYQLVRNVLAACVRNRAASMNNGHAVLIYDANNPNFSHFNGVDGEDLLKFNVTRQALQQPNTLRKCSWQNIVHYLRQNNILPWLTELLIAKYRFDA